MSRFDINVHGLPLGDPHNPPGSSKIQNDPFTAAAVAASVMSAYSSYQQGQIQGKQLELKGRLEQTQYDRRAIQYQQRANQTLEKLKRTQASLAATAYAGGVDPFSGSPDVVRAANDTSAGREFLIYMDDSAAALVFDQLTTDADNRTLDLWRYADDSDSDKPLMFILGLSTVCAVQKDMSGHPKRMKSRHRRIVAVARLAEPHCVWVR